MEITRSKIVGVINATPDSFFSGSRAQSIADIRKCAQAMIAAGADVLEVGGESTRPGSTPISVDEELERVIPAIRVIRTLSDVAISLDTRKSKVACAAVDEGIQIINDVSALQDDPSLASLVADSGCKVVLMHMQGRPQTMQDAPYYEDVLLELSAFLKLRIDHARQVGIAEDRIIVDPGIGFGKGLQDNLQILRHISLFRDLGCPLMVGLSRKQFIGRVLGTKDRPLPVEERLAGTLGGVAWCVMQGVAYIRVHDVSAAIHLQKVIMAIRDELA